MLSEASKGSKLSRNRSSFYSSIGASTKYGNKGIGTHAMKRLEVKPSIME